MIEEAYVSFETARLLKEKGFDELCFAYYYTYNDLEGKCLKLWRKFPRRPINTDYLNVPTQQMAMRWLREVYKIDISIYPYGNYSPDNYQFDVYENRYLIVSKDDGYMTYEEAIEAGIKYCLENLI